MLALLELARGVWQAGGVELTQEQDERIKDCLPRQRGNVRIDNRTLLNALLFGLENGCK